MKYPASRLYNPLRKQEVYHCIAGMVKRILFQISRRCPTWRQFLTLYNDSLNGISSDFVGEKPIVNVATVASN